MFKANFLKRQYCFRKLINISLMQMQKKKCCIRPVCVLPYCFDISDFQRFPTVRFLLLAFLAVEVKWKDGKEDLDKIILSWLEGYTFCSLTDSMWITWNIVVDKYGSLELFQITSSGKNQSPGFLFFVFFFLLYSHSLSVTLPTTMINHILALDLMNSWILPHSHL